MKNAAKLGWKAQLKRLGEPVAFSKSNHYFSDGNIAIIEAI